MKKTYIVFFLLSLFLTAAFAQDEGSFDYLTVKGPGITGELNITNPALTQDFFAFADFSRGAIPPPADPGQAYRVVRVYVEGAKDAPFDQLHYYPYTGYVYYAGLVEGSSEYDGQWYAANPSASEPFRAALAERARLNWIPFAILLLILAGFWYAYRSKPKGTSS